LLMDPRLFDFRSLDSTKECPVEGDVWLDQEPASAH
jgi:hypothetical protein